MKMFKQCKALKILSEKKLGILDCLRNKNNKTIGIITDGQIRRFSQKKINFLFISSKKNYDKKTSIY